MERKFEQITIFGTNVKEFNNKYSQHFSIVKGEGILLKDFWVALDKKGNECGMFLCQNNELIETPWSSGKYNFMRNLSSGLIHSPTEKETQQPRTLETQTIPFLCRTENYVGLAPPKKRRPEIETPKKLPAASFWSENNREQSEYRRKNTCNSRFENVLKYLNPYDDCDMLSYESIVSDVVRIIADCATDYPEDLDNFMTYARVVNKWVLNDAVIKIKANEFNSYSPSLIELIDTSHEESRRKSFMIS